MKKHYFLSNKDTHNNNLDISLRISHVTKEKSDRGIRNIDGNSTKTYTKTAAC